MSQSNHKRPTGKLRRRIAGLSLRLKLFIGVGTLISGLLIVGSISVISGVTTQQLVSRTLARQRQLADLTTRINNTLLNAQNQAFDFYNTWSLTGFERETSGFDYAQQIYVTPIRANLDQIRTDIETIRELNPDQAMRSNLDKIATSVGAYETTLISMSDQMERLGFRDTGESGQLLQIFDSLQTELGKTELQAAQSSLYEMKQYAESYFLRSELINARLVREANRRIQEQISTIPDAQLSPTTKVQFDGLLEDYYDHFLRAANLYNNLQTSRANLVGQSDLTSTLVQELYQEQQAQFSAKVQALQRQQARTTTATGVLTTIVLVSGTVIAYFVIGQIIQPVRTLGQIAERLGGGELGVRAPIDSRDEIGATAIAFNLMADRLQELLAELEQRVADRTHDLETTAADLTARTAELEKVHQAQQLINRELEETVRQSERRAALLQASAEVSRAITQLRDPAQGRGVSGLDQLLTEVTHLISQHFGFYHAGVFLIDEARRFAVLRAANSPGGQRMLARQHRLGVGSEGIVGYVTQAGRPRIALDVGADAYYFNNPDLPDTRSEMAVPLHIGDEVIGALDVQSTQEAAFDDQDVRVLTALAAQIAIAIQNANLFRQTQEALSEAQHVQQSYIRQQWTQLVREQSPLIHEYTLSGVPPLGDSQLPEVQEALRTGQMIIADGNGDPEHSPVRTALAVPIQVRGQTIGVLDLQETDHDRRWTADELALIQSIADQMGQALEGARLFEETQRRAQRELLARQITERIRAAGAAGDIGSILQTTAEELGKALRVTRAVARLQVPTSGDTLQRVEARQPQLPNDKPSETAQPHAPERVSPKGEPAIRPKFALSTAQRRVTDPA